MKEHVRGHRGVTAYNIRASRGTVRSAELSFKAQFILFVGWFNHCSFKKDLMRHVR